MYQFEQFNPEEFLTSYWQKKPVLLKGLFKNFIDPLSADELAGLAQETEIESRVVQRQDNGWHVEHGPFEQFEQFGDTDWSLLVQAVDHWHMQSAQLLEPFRFIPNWRIDDLMISFSVPGGGVGAHVDQYDVFIIQGMGKRHWKVGDKQPLESKLPHPDLLQVAGFNPCIDAVLEPGDVLYIPPGCPHEGYAIEPALNYSVGFRAPNQQDLLSSFADFALQEECFKQRYQDPQLQLSQFAGDVTTAEADKLVELVKLSLKQPQQVNKWLGGYLTQAKHDLDLQLPEPSFEVDDIVEINQQVSTWLRTGGLRILTIQGQLFINGEWVDSQGCSDEFIRLLADKLDYPTAELTEQFKLPANLELFSALVNEGYIYPYEEDEE
ncbi:hypothetical protein DS2_05860 [Catenovulum agarivorans DS-2]|uniref:JmjC domain-containing protein n=1 Tax=Catenovulum agarivorans DS-2 TaxID=1328313 RepID=W7R0E2_9ALTE|nr:cupin domain-containing protein [Catenovulum agarivorans]EWH11070.1 hypothetical protein DS2_05860 [Catenovulum agarivorans DS-2]